MIIDKGLKKQGNSIFLPWGNFEKGDLSPSGVPI
jgi:hypothetical protein